MPKPEAQHWAEFGAYSDAASAEVVAGLLRSEGVPVDIESDQPMPGLTQGFRLMVPVDLLHRARWILDNASFTEEELAYFATGRLGPDEQSER